jgi:hypothetical protein
VFGACILEERDDLGPFLLLVLADEAEDDDVFVDLPLALLDILVEVVLPALSALLGGLEVGALGEAIKLLRDLVPLPLWVFAA